LLLSTGCLTFSIYEVVALGRELTMPLAGIGLLFAALAFFLMMTGMLGELVHEVGDNRAERMSMLTAEFL
jgi:hypothetical protein